uniref:IncF plasmid conjugative transfer pilus assemblyprotein TraC n=1 Tax=Vibrio tasmaniensis TaxID=212663 RepID=A0A0H3ZRV4_9VIBR|nr:IncF plasmid conjugative transfer pilus assemblyprotein TraC [Vibrio tasmaniensis]
MKQGMPSIEAIDATAQHFYGQEIADYQQALQQKAQGVSYDV